MAGVDQVSPIFAYAVPSVLPGFDGVPAVVPSSVSGLPRLQSGIGPTMALVPVSFVVRVYGPGAVTSSAVRYLPPIPRPNRITRRQSPFIAPVDEPESE